MIKLKSLLEDTDQNNNGYPDSTEGNLARTNVDTYYTKPPTGFQFTNKPIDSQANKLLMNYWDNILNSQEKQQEYQDDRKAGDSNWRDGIELYNRYMLIAGRAENQLKVSGYIIKTGNLIDTDSNNNGYPDETNQMEKTEKVAKSKQEWWSLVRADLSEWNLKNHEDDRMSIGDWIGEVGPNIHGWIAFKDRYGDWDASLTGYEDDEDEDDDDSW